MTYLLVQTSYKRHTRFPCPALLASLILEDVLRRRLSFLVVWCTCIICSRRHCQSRQQCYRRPRKSIKQLRLGMACTYVHFFPLRLVDSAQCDMASERDRRHRVEGCIHACPKSCCSDDPRREDYLHHRPERALRRQHRRGRAAWCSYPLSTRRTGRRTPYSGLFSVSSWPGRRGDMGS